MRRVYKYGTSLSVETELELPGEHPRVVACGMDRRADPEFLVWAEVDPDSLERRWVQVAWMATGFDAIPDGWFHVGTVIDYDESGTVWHCYAKDGR